MVASLKLAYRSVLESVPPRFFDRLAVVLACILAVQTFLRFQRAAGVVEAEEKLGVPFERTTLHLWNEFQARGGRLNDTSVPLTTRHLDLLTQADVEGANMDHNMSISNPCISSTDLLKRAYLQPPPPPFSAFGQHRFLMRSGYRTSPRDFAAVGLQLLNSTRPTSDLEVRREQDGDCFWMGADGRKIEGVFKPVYPGEHHELMYETVVFKCHLEEPTTGRGGGSAIMLLDGDHVIMHSEGPNAPDIYREPSFFLGFCSFPMYRDLNPTALKDWLQFHHHSVGVEYFVLNDGGSIHFDLFPVLEPYVRAGRLEVVDMRGEFKYETKHNVISLNDCMHKMAYTASWVLFLDFDEFMHTNPPTTFMSVLREAKGVPYVTFGSLWWSVYLCRNPGRPYLESMLFHWPHFYCVGEHVHYDPTKCINYFGHRKFLVNPRRVDAIQVHRPIEPKDGGVDLNVTIAHINHFQGILRADAPLCNETQGADQSPDWWKEETFLKDAWLEIKHLTAPRSL